MRPKGSTITRRTVLATGAALAATAATGPAFGQAFPSKPITLIIPWPAGGSTDVSMRAMAEVASKQLGQQIVIDNKPGASGTLGPATMAATAKPDGYTIAQLPISVFRLPYMQKTSFDPEKDFTYIVHVTGYTFGVVVRKDSKYQTFKDLVEDARANPGKIKYATPGAGTSLHITMEQIAAKAGIKWTQVPFKGGAETSAAVLGGHVDATRWSMPASCACSAPGARSAPRSGRTCRRSRSSASTSSPIRRSVSAGRRAYRPMWCRRSTTRSRRRSRIRA
jgi:tripartite-type tricarboxylate transporter receptor subunit TctC